MSFHHYCKQIRPDPDEDKCPDCQKVLAKLVKQEQDMGNPVKLCSICNKQIFSKETVVFNPDMTVVSHYNCLRIEQWAS